MPPKVSSPAQRFRRDVCWNPYIAKELALRQIGICTVCSRALGSYRLVVHHLDYAHECGWRASLILLVGKRRRSIPDCLGCRIDSDHRFQMCRRRLQLLHRRCHLDLHKGGKATSAEKKAEEILADAPSRSGRSWPV